MLFFIFLDICRCQQYINYKCCIKMILRQICRYVDPYINCPMLLLNKRMFVDSRPSFDSQHG